MWLIPHIYHYAINFSAGMQDRRGPYRPGPAQAAAGGLDDLNRHSHLHPGHAIPLRRCRQPPACATMRAWPTRRAQRHDHRIQRTSRPSRRRARKTPTPTGANIPGRMMTSASTVTARRTGGTTDSARLIRQHARQPGPAATAIPTSGTPRSPGRGRSPVHARVLAADRQSLHGGPAEPPRKRAGHGSARSRTWRPLQVLSITDAMTIGKTSVVPPSTGIVWPVI